MKSIALLLVAGCCLAASGNLPVTPAETLADQKIVFPTALAGKAAVCVFGFSKEAGDRTKVWMTRLSQDGINAWSIANLEGAPGLVRGMIRSSMRKGTPQPLLQKSVIMTKDEKVWKQAVGAKQDNLPVVAILDGSGHLLWTYEGLFGEEPYRDLKARIETVNAFK